jgi:hypothetical protein
MRDANGIALLVTANFGDHELRRPGPEAFKRAKETEREFELVAHRAARSATWQESPGFAAPSRPLGPASPAWSASATRSLLRWSSLTSNKVGMSIRSVDSPQHGQHRLPTGLSSTACESIIGLCCGLAVRTSRRPSPALSTSHESVPATLRVNVASPARRVRNWLVAGERVLSKRILTHLYKGLSERRDPLIVRRRSRLPGRSPAAGRKRACSTFDFKTLATLSGDEALSQCIINDDLALRVPVNRTTQPRGDAGEVACR